MLESDAAMLARQRASAKFVGKSLTELVLGRPEAAALGIAAYLKVDLFDPVARLHDGA